MSERRHPPPETTQTRELTHVETLRKFIHRERLSGSAAVMFNELFPEHMPPTPFKLESVKQHGSVEYTPEQKKMANCALQLFGYTSSKDREYPGDEDLPNLRIAYSGFSGAPTTYLNKLPFVTLLGDQGQTNPMLPQRLASHGERQIKITRKDHSKHLASMVVRDMVRMAIITPDLFVRRVIQDMARYRFGDGQTLPSFLNPAYYQGELEKRIKPRKSNDQIFALALALEYGKYIALYAYLHDERTPAWGDTVMKARERFPGQTSLDYSEDEVLYRDIGQMSTSENTGIPQFLAYFKMDPRFFITLVQSLSKENDTCLGGLLMKAKRKPGYRERGGPLELENRASFDEDQMSGTTANMMDLANQILPGGFRHMYKTRSSVPSQTAQIKDPPIGSFYERLQLLSYALIAGISKEQLIRYCKRHNIPPERIYIAAEEFQVGPNFKLMNVAFNDRDEIMPVALHPGSLKRIMESFAALTYFHYQSDRRSPTETLVQDILTAVHNWQIRKIRLQNHSQKESFTEVIKMPMYRSDYGYSQVLEDELPIITFIYKELFARAKRISPSELIQRRENAIAHGNHILISRAQVHPVEGPSTKPGSLTIDYKGAIRPYLEVIDKRLNQTTGEIEENPTSLPKRLKHTADALRFEDYFYYIELDDAVLNTMLSLVARTPDPEIREVVKRALRYWTMDLVIQNQLVTNPLSKHKGLLLGSENSEANLLEQSDENVNLFYLMQAQIEEQRRSF